MDRFIGTWNLESNDNLDDFLLFYGYGWVSIEVAKLAHVEIRFERTNQPHTFRRLVESVFHTSDETYIMDGTFHSTPENVVKKHTIDEETLHSECHKDEKMWVERITVETGKLVVRRNWMKNGQTQSCVQTFS
jgi:hypothetical protein